MTSIQASIANPIALSSAIANYNYLWPSYSLPWNNFFRKVSPTPYYVANEISNIEYRELKSPLIFDANPQAYAFNPTTLPSPLDLGCILPTDGSTVLLASASKTFQGTSYDIKSRKAGLTYEYSYAGTIVSTTNFNIPAQNPQASVNWVLLGLNLAVPPTFAVSIQTKYAANTTNGCTGAPCTLGTTCAVALKGQIDLFNNNAPIPITTAYIFQPTPYLNSSVGCSLVTTPQVAHYTIVGNRLYLLVPLSNAFTTIPDTISYAVTVRTVESSVVADPALVPAIAV